MGKPKGILICSCNVRVGTGARPAAQVYRAASPSRNSCRLGDRIPARNGWIPGRCWRDLANWTTLPMSSAGDVEWVTRFLRRFPALRAACDAQGKPFKLLAQESGNQEIADLFGSTAQAG